MSNDSMSLVSDQKSKRFMNNEVQELIECERRIFKLTLTGLIYTIEDQKTNMRYQYGDGPGMERRLQPIEEELAVAKQQSELLERNVLGFTSVKGFLVLQVISELVNVMHSIITKECPLSQFRADSDPDTRYIKKGQIEMAVAQKSTFTKITQVLALMHECL